MNRLKESNVFSGGGVIPLNNRRTLLKSYIWNYVVSNSGKVTLENSIKGDIDLELIGGTEQPTTTGKNLANPSEFVIATLAGDTGNIIALKQYITTGYIPVIPGKMYSTSCGNKFLTHTIIAYDKEKIKINYPMNMSSEMPEGAAYIRLSYKKIDMTNVTESDMEELKKVCMLNEGSTVLPYEPYTGGKISPSPEYQQEIKNSGRWNDEKQKYEIDIILNGSNLWNEKTMIRGHLTADGEIIYKEDDSNCIWTIVVPRDGKYTVKIEKESVGGLYFTRIFNDKISEPYVRLNPGQKGVLTLKKGENKIQASSTSALRPIGNEKVMLSYGDQEPPTYEAYQEPQTLTLTSDRPLTKWDKLVEQGGQYGWLYGSDIKTFESDVFKLYADNDKAIQYQAPFEEISNSWGELVCYCNTFENAIGQTIYTQSGKTDFYMGCVHKSMVFSAKNKQGIFQSIEAFQEWIRNSGTYVWYKTDNKKFVPLSESEQTQLRNLHSYNGTTNITVDSGEVPCGIKVAYKQKK